MQSLLGNSLLTGSRNGNNRYRGCNRVRDWPACDWVAACDMGRILRTEDTRCATALAYLSGLRLLLTPPPGENCVDHHRLHRGGGKCLRRDCMVRTSRARASVT